VAVRTVDDTRSIALGRKQLIRQDGDEDKIVDAENDL